MTIVLRALAVDKIVLQVLCEIIYIIFKYHTLYFITCLCLGSYCQNPSMVQQCPAGEIYTNILINILYIMLICTVGSYCPSRSTGYTTCPAGNERIHESILVCRWLSVLKWRLLLSLQWHVTILWLHPRYLTLNIYLYLSNPSSLTHICLYCTV